MTSIGPKSQLRSSKADPNKVRVVYNHAQYVEPRRRMMRVWSDQLDLLEQDPVEAASVHFTIYIEGMPAMAGKGEPVAAASTTTAAVKPVAVASIVVTLNDAETTFQRLSQIPRP